MIAVPLPVRGFQVRAVRPVHNGFVLVTTESGRLQFTGVTLDGTAILGDSQLLDTAIVLRSDGRLQTNWRPHMRTDKDPPGYVIDATSFLPTHDPLPASMAKVRPNPYVCRPNTDGLEYKCVPHLFRDLELAVSETQVCVVRFGTSSVHVDLMDVGRPATSGLAVSLDNLTACVVTQDDHAVLFDL